MVERDGTGAFGTMARAIVGGAITPDTICTLHCVAAGGAEALLFQPYVKRVQLPGEFQATVAGAVPVPLEVRGGGFFHREVRLRWVLSAICMATVVLAPIAIYLLFFYGRPSLVGADGKAVRIGPLTTQAIGKLRFSARFGRGKIVPRWLVQIYPRGDGTTRCVMHAADYGGLVTKDPGFSVFAGLCLALSKELPRTAGTATSPIQSPRFQA